MAKLLGCCVDVGDWRGAGFPESYHDVWVVAVRCACTVHLFCGYICMLQTGCM